MEEKYFYTVLFLDDYNVYRKDNDSSTTVSSPKQMEVPTLKKFEITSKTNTENIKWLNSTTLYVRHNLQLPLTLEMWNNDDKPVFYCPVLKEGIESISVGSVVIESSRSISLHFNEDNPPPQLGETFVLAIKELPSMDTKNSRIVNENSQSYSKSLDEILDVEYLGKAIIFRRKTLDELFDLIVDFDESYWHSLAEGTELKYLTRLSNYQTCKFTTKYTSNLQDVLDLIDTNSYEIKYSWNEIRKH